MHYTSEMMQFLLRITLILYGSLFFLANLTCALQIKAGDNCLAYRSDSSSNPNSAAVGGRSTYLKTCNKNDYTQTSWSIEDIYEQPNGLETFKICVKYQGKCLTPVPANLGRLVTKSDQDPSQMWFYWGTSKQLKNKFGGGDCAYLANGNLVLQGCTLKNPPPPLQIL